jgi:hypothetical protein
VIGIIREHNVFTGYRLVVWEYGIVAALLGLLALGYTTAGRWVEALAWLGIVANALVILTLALASIRRGDRDFGSLPMRRAAFRRSVGRHRPGLGRRTTALILASFVPFLVPALVSIELARHRDRSSAFHSRRPRQLAAVG